LTVLIAGGTGLVGAAIVRALASSQVVRKIVVTSRSEARLAALLLDLGSLGAEVIPLVTDAGVTGDGVALRAAIEQTVPNVDAAIASLGGGKSDGRRFVDLSRAAFDTMMAEMLGAHVAFATATLPLLTDDGLYLGIGGGAAYAPMHGGGAISIAAAAQVMMTRVLAAENERSRHSHPRTRHRRARRGARDTEEPRNDRTGRGRYRRGRTAPNRDDYAARN
jgi:NAD(P)-dependent dehydrogenase (short-subunit alcohol dehydrogenase family)